MTRKSGCSTPCSTTELRSKLPATPSQRPKSQDRLGCDRALHGGGRSLRHPCDTQSKLQKEPRRRVATPWEAGGVGPAPFSPPQAIFYTKPSLSGTSEQLFLVEQTKPAGFFRRGLDRVAPQEKKVVPSKMARERRRVRGSDYGFEWWTFERTFSSLNLVKNSSV